ncbi:MAG: hypothetical protein ABI361_06090 [Nitrososphaera sp.]|jgi:hypothetical protein
MDSQPIDLLPPEKIAFIAYNIGVYESVQKFGNLITSGRLSGITEPDKVVEMLLDTVAFYDSDMISQLINSMIRSQSQPPDPPTISRVSASEVTTVIKQLIAAGVPLRG